MSGPQFGSLDSDSTFWPNIMVGSSLSADLLPLYYSIFFGEYMKMGIPMSAVEIDPASNRHSYAPELYAPET
jgi:hypothetical protein